MALINQWFFVKKVIDIDKILQATHNQYRVVSCRLYTDKKGELPEGITLTLMVLKDDFDYGIDKTTGQPRDNNLYQNFDVQILNRNHTIRKGDIVQLLGFDAEHSFAFDYSMLLRFKDVKILQSQGAKPNA